MDGRAHFPWVGDAGSVVRALRAQAPDRRALADSPLSAREHEVLALVAQGLSLQHRARRASRPVRIIDAPAERLPFPDASLDTVVSILVLCTVGDPAQALSEIVRVLRPGGRLLFIEHVRSDSRALAWCQDRLMGPWGRFAEGVAATVRRHS